MSKRSLLSILCTWILLAACSMTSILGPEQEQQGRTYYETLDLSSPEAAVTTLTDAFTRDDFLTVYLVLSNHSQFMWVQRLQLMQYDHLIQPDSFEIIRDDVSVFSGGIGKGEHVDAGWYIFDQIMLAAKRHDRLLIDLSGDITIIDNSSVDFGKYDIDEAVDVVAEVEGIEGEVIFRTIQAPSGRWRVYQVIVPEGDQEMVPWSVPNSGS